MNVRFSYDRRFEKMLSEIKGKYGENILRFSGVHPDQLDMADFTRKFLFNGNGTSVADLSVDANANIDDKSVVTFDHEVAKALNKLNALNMIWSFMVEVYKNKQLLKRTGKVSSLTLANEAMEEIISCALYLNDAHFSHKPYCFGFDLAPLVNEGMPFYKKIHIGPPKHYNSIINLIIQSTAFISNQLAGACLYKDQGLTIRSDKNITTLPRVQSFVEQFDLSETFTNQQGEWESCNISHRNYQVWEDGKYVNIKRVYRRKYDSDIYTVTTRSGKKAQVSKDHIFKVLYRDRYIEVKAKDLNIYDTVINTLHKRPAVDKSSSDYRHGQFDGIIAGDGSITEKNTSSVRVAINYFQRFIADFLDEYCLEFFGKKGTLDNGNKCWDYRLHSRKALAITKSHFTDGLDTYTKNINIKDKSFEYLAGFMDGIMVTDGSYMSSVIKLTLTNNNMITTITSILNKFGIGYTRSLNKGNRGNRKDSFTLRIDTPIICYFSIFNERYKGNKKYLSIRTNEVYYRGKQACAKAQEPSKLFSTLAQNNITRLSDTDKRHKMHDYRSLHLDVIVDIHIASNDHDYVYEVETETGWYSVGGILTHNCSWPNLLLYLDFFARKDYGRRYWEDKEKLDIVEQGLQSLVYSLNFSFRGSQCVTEDTEILTPNGFKKYHELSEGDYCYTWKDTKLNIQKIEKVNVYDYDGEMHKYAGRDYIQQVTPEHKVVRKKFNSHEYETVESRHIIDMKTPATFPVACIIDDRPDNELSDTDIELLAFFMTDGSIDDQKGKSKRLKWSKSSNRWGMSKFEELISSIEGCSYSVSEKEGWADRDTQKYKEGYITYAYTVNVETSKVILNLMNYRRDVLPDSLMTMSKRQAILFIHTWAKLDGYYRPHNYEIIRLQCDNMIIVDQIQHICFLAGMGSRFYERTIGSNKSNTLYVQAYIRKNKDASTKERVHYKGKVWCPTTEDGVVVFRKEGKTFISGNSSFSNISIYDDGFLKEIFSTTTYPDGSKVDFESVKMLQKVFMEWYNKESEKQVFTFPVITANLVCENGEIEDQEFLDYISEVNLPQGTLNIYTGPATCLSSCCRLRSELVKEHTNSLGSGSVSIGSHKVCTINLPRIAIEADGSKKKFMQILEDRIGVTHAVLNTHRHIMKKLIAQGKLPLYTYGWMHLSQQYSTVGLLGPYEACSFMGMDIISEEGSDFVVDIMRKINDMNTDEEKFWGDGRRFNLELIPGEQAAVKLCESDKMLYPDFPNPYILYSNQFIPLISNADIHDRMMLQGKFDSLAQGGCIMHINIDHKLNNKEQMKRLISTASKMGALYFAVNLNLAMCKDNHVNVGKGITVCNTCGGEIVKNMTRVVGFITEVSDWNKVRRWEYEERHFYNPEEVLGKENKEFKEATTE